MPTYLTPKLKPLPKKDTREMVIEGTGTGRNNPRQTQIGDITIMGEQYGDAPVGLGNQGVQKRSERDGYKGFTVPGTATFIRNMVDRADKSGGTNPNAWDEGDIGPIGRLIGVTPQDLINRETDLRRMRLAEDPRFKNKKLAGTNKDLQVYFGDTAESLQKRLDMAESVAQRKISEPQRVQRERTDARVITDNQNTALRAEEQRNLAFAATHDNNVEARLHREGEATANREWRESQATQQRLDNEAAIRRELNREKNQLAREERMDNFMLQRYYDEQDRLDRAEKREERRAIQQAIGATFEALGSFFY
ncbi:MAG: hypothetical protein CMM87_01060 [Rickettsiales bacterium]|nr:hypothetical protein [Rickettsiales bacterium]